MPIENATYISDLNPDWPVGSSDFISQGDDQMRMQKKVLQNTFPNATAPITGTPTQLNQLASGIWYQSASENPTVPDIYRLFTDSTGATQAALATKTPTIGELSISTNIAVVWQNIIDLIYPVGCQYVSYTDSRNPSDILLFGTWEPVVGMIAGVGVATDINGYAQTLSPGYQPGWWRVNNSQIVGQQLNVQLTMNAVPPHTHGEGTMKSYWGDSNHTSLTPGDGDGQTGSAGGHTPTGTGSVTIGSGSTTDGTQFYNPYYGVYIWRRTA
ncbi:phage baseplate protein [Salmonella enterica subsp. houtenae serovar 6,7:z4,z24:-]